MRNVSVPGLGSCCLTNGSCLFNVSSTSCANNQGIFHQGQTCASVMCPPVTGACCRPSGCTANSTAAACTAEGGTYKGNGSACNTSAADIDHNGIVNVNDLLLLINAWGPCGMPCPPHCSADIDHNCLANVNDLLMVINAWGC